MRSNHRLARALFGFSSVVIIGVLASVLSWVTGLAFAVCILLVMVPVAVLSVPTARRISK